MNSVITKIIILKDDHLNTLLLGNSAKYFANTTLGHRYNRPTRALPRPRRLQINSHILPAQKRPHLHRLLHHRPFNIPPSSRLSNFRRPGHIHRRPHVRRRSRRHRRHPDLYARLPAQPNPPRRASPPPHGSQSATLR